MSGALLTRVKRVTDPLDDKVKARIVGGYASSGSEHSAHNEDGSPSFSELFFGSGEMDGGDYSSDKNDDSDSDKNDDSSISSDVNNNNNTVELIRRMMEEDHRDEFQKLLSVYVKKAVQFLSAINSNKQKQLLRREVMTYLRNCGYNAAICKTKWESSGGLTAGNYEFIDVVWAKYNVRYVVDLDFASEFEIARPNSAYQRLMQYIPTIYVGKSDNLKQILKTVSDGARRSMKSRGLLLPPWRKNRFMQNKWLGPYRRTTNLYPTTSFCHSPNGNVMCRSVGFDAAVKSPATARTR